MEIEYGNHMVIIILIKHDTKNLTQRILSPFSFAPRLDNEFRLFWKFFIWSYIVFICIYVRVFMVVIIKTTRFQTPPVHIITTNTFSHILINRGLIEFIKKFRLIDIRLQVVKRRFQQLFKAFINDNCSIVFLPIIRSFNQAITTIFIEIFQGSVIKPVDILRLEVGVFAV